MELFCELNGYRFTTSDDELFDLVIDVAGGTLSTVQEIAHTLIGLVEERP